MIFHMFLRQKKFKNKDGSERIYAQLCHSTKVDGVSKHKILLDLGRIDKIEGKEKLEALTRTLAKACETIHLLDMSKDLKAHDALEFGPHYIFSKVWSRLGLKQIFDEEFKKYSTDFNISSSVYNMVLNRLSSPTSKLGLEYWQESVFNIDKFDIHQYYRAMDYLVENKDQIESRIFDQQRDLFNQSIDVVLFDTTTIVYYGKGDEEESGGLLAKGFSKDHRGDLNQVVVGVMVSKQGVPLGHEVFSGNKNDVTCFKEIIDKISDKFKIGKVVLVGDRGMINQKNLDHLDKKGYEYILGYRMRTIKKSERSKVLSKANLKKIKKDELTCKEVTYEGKRLIVFYNPERAVKDAKKREEIVQKIKEKIASGDVKNLFAKQEYKKFVSVSTKSPELDIQKVLEDAVYDGVFVLTSNTSLTPLEIVNGYRDLWQVEMAFRQLKSELKMGPMYHIKERRIRAHIMICFLSLILRSELYRKLKKKYKNASYPTTLKDMRAMKVVDLEVKSEKVLLRTEVKPGMMKAIKALKLSSPPRVLSGHKVTSILH